MIADSLPLSAVEINHVITNLENHQFLTVPSKFSISESPQLWLPDWSSIRPKMTPNELDTNKSFRRCLSLSSPGMMNSRMRGLRERNRPVNDYNIPKKEFESGHHGSSGCFHFQVQHLESTKIWRWFDLSWPPFDLIPLNLTNFWPRFYLELAIFDRK